MDQLIIFFAVYFPYILILLAVLFLLKFKSWRGLIISLATSGSAWTIAYILKNLMRVSRPDVQALFLADGYAFPSGHATFFMALAISIFFFHKKTGYWFMLAALLVGLARIMAGVHSPVDILGGFVLGALVAYLVKYIYDKFAYLPGKV